MSDSRYSNLARRPALALILGIAAVLCLSTLAWAEEGDWVVAGVDGGAWKSTDLDPSVRTALHPGDSIGENDRIETFQNNQVALTTDPKGKNMVSVKGGAFRVRPTSSGTRIQLDHGRALAVLNDLRDTGNFSVETPMGVAAVRGTYFSVESQLSRMEVKTYRGEVSVQIPSSPGFRGSTLLVAKDQKTRFDSGISDSLKINALLDRDREEFEKGLQFILAAKKSLKSSGRRWFKALSKPSRSIWVPAVKKDGSDSDRTGQTIVF